MASGNWLSDMLALVTSVIRDNAPPSNSEGIVQSGSWNPTNGTVQHIFGDTAAILPGDEDGDQALIVDDFPVVTTQIGDQYAPTGNQRTVAIPTPSGYVTMFVHGPDDSPQVPAGERWVYHYNSSGVVDSFWKHTNDGPTVGDGLGGAHYGGTAALSQMTTKSGHAMKMDDTAKTVTTTSANGLQQKLDDNVQKITHTAASVQSILDGANNQIAHVAGTIGIGDLPANLSSINAAMRNTDLTTFENSLKTMRLNDLSNLATAISQALATASPPVTVSASAIIALITSLAHISVPSGSAVTLIK